jgi:hypothetical protein
VTFDFYSFRFTFIARDPVIFPAPTPGSVLRGGFGSLLRRIACAPDCPGHAGRPASECELYKDCVYARIFEPSSQAAGPSGLSDWPRPFVLRAAHLSGLTIPPGEPFWFDVNLFEMRYPVIGYFEQAFRQLAAEGMGPGHGRADLVSVQQLDPVSVSLEARPADIRRLRVHFLTPTELKAGAIALEKPEFAILFARARDRVSTLRSLYGPGPLAIDFQALGDLASAVRMTECHVGRLESLRRSSRTGQLHDVGGFIGWAEYEGDLAAFLPILDAARWTGVGRHCVWGNGELKLLFAHRRPMR